MNSLRYLSRFSSITLLCFALLSIFMISSTAQLISYPLYHQHSSLAQDTVRPEIHDWGIDGSVRIDSTVTVWANVTDTESDVLNVSAVVREDLNVSSITYTLMTFNGSYFTASLNSFEVNHTYYIWIVSYDSALNLAQSYNRQYDLHVYPGGSIDPTITFPYVVSGSIITMFVTILLARWYYLRNLELQDEMVDSDMDTEEATESETS